MKALSLDHSSYNHPSESMAAAVPEESTAAAERILRAALRSRAEQGLSLRLLAGLEPR